MVSECNVSFMDAGILFCDQDCGGQNFCHSVSGSDSAAADDRFWGKSCSCPDSGCDRVDGDRDLAFDTGDHLSDRCEQDQERKRTREHGSEQRTG